MNRIFLLSPASCGGKRAQFLLNPDVTFDLATRVRAGQATLAEVYSFLSGLYFRGKIAYARHFAHSQPKLSPYYVITPSRGLLSGDEKIDLALLEEFSRVSIAVNEERYAEPFRRDLSLLAAKADADISIILLGSIATDKYVKFVLEFFAGRLHFPKQFVGRGDMSRGGLLLRAVAADSELEYAALTETTILKGMRPKKLPKLQKVSHDSLFEVWEVFSGAYLLE